MNNLPDLNMTGIALWVYSRNNTQPVSTLIKNYQNICIKYKKKCTIKP